MIAKTQLQKLSEIKNINKVYLVMEEHTVLHNSNNLLRSLFKRYGEENVVFDISLKDYEIPTKLKESLKVEENYYKEKIA